MSSTLVLTLDTRPPVVTWAAPSNTVAGEYLAVPFSLNEGTASAPTLVLSDGRQVAAEIVNSMVRAVLPIDTPTGWATVSVLATDAVGNAARSSAPVGTTAAVSGVGPGEPPPPPPPPPAPPPPAPAPRVPVPTPGPIPTGGVQFRTIRSRSRVRVASTTRVQSRAAVASSTAVRSSTRASRRVASTSRVRVRGDLAVNARLASVSRVRAASSTEVQRRDGPTIEAIILGLI